MTEQDITISTDRRLAARANGYQPLPALGKKVLLDDWSAKTDVSEDEIAAWGVDYPQWVNSSVLTRNTPTPDIDIRDPEAAEAVEEMLRDWLDSRGTVIVRIGQSPKRAILCRTDRPFAKISVNLVAPNGDYHKIEILGDGQQLVVDGSHPDTGKPYTWFGGDPWTVPWANLPQIDEAEAQEFVARAVKMLEDRFSYRRVETRGNGGPVGEQQTKPPVDVEAAFAAIHHGNIHNTWLDCTGSLLRKGVPADEVFRRNLEAVQQSPACQADPSKKKWTRSLADVMAWHMHTDPLFVTSLGTDTQVK